MSLFFCLAYNFGEWLMALTDFLNGHAHTDLQKWRWTELVGLCRCSWAVEQVFFPLELLLSSADQLERKKCFNGGCPPFKPRLPELIFWQWISPKSRGGPLCWGRCFFWRDKHRLHADWLGSVLPADHVQILSRLTWFVGGKEAGASPTVCRGEIGECSNTESHGF